MAAAGSGDSTLMIVKTGVALGLPGFGLGSRSQIHHQQGNASVIAQRLSTPPW
jgi:hypothetical protein